MLSPNLNYETDQSSGECAEGGGRRTLTLHFTPVNQRLNLSAHFVVAPGIHDDNKLVLLHKIVIPDTYNADAIVVVPIKFLLLVTYHIVKNHLYLNYSYMKHYYLMLYNH
jgi:hypothetical protein